MTGYQSNVLEKINKHLEEMSKHLEYSIRKINCFAQADEGIKYLIENNKFNEEEVGELLYDRLYKHCIKRKDINEYVKTRNLKTILSR